METNKVLFNKLNDYFKHNIRMSLVFRQILIIITKRDLFYCIDIKNENIPSFIISDESDENSVIESMIIEDLCHKQIDDIKLNFWAYSCFARNDNEYNIYYYDIKYRVMKEHISEEKIIDMCCGEKHSIILTQSGKVYEYEMDGEVDEEISDELGDIVDSKERVNSEKYIHFELKSFKNSSFENEKTVMISCGGEHSLALTENGRVFGWGDNYYGQLGVDVKYYSNKPIIIELNDLKIKKISCGYRHSLLLSCDGDIYAFGWNDCGEVGNGTYEKQKFPIKLELTNKFIDIASHPYHLISMSQSIDGIYYVWGVFKGEDVWSPLSTKFESFEDILRANG
jgi:hypothetical protein